MTDRGNTPQAVSVLQTPTGDPFAVVVDPRAQARVQVAPDGSAVTLSFSLPDTQHMPCSIMLGASVAAQLFGQDFATTLRAHGTSTGHGTAGPLRNLE